MDFIQRNKVTLINLLIIALYTVWGATGLIHHEIWRDEFHSWLIASESTSLADLWSKVVYEGHPLGWYLILYIAHKFSDSYVSMQIAHLVIAVSCVIMVLYKSPFPLWLKVLFIFGAILGYEYLVLARNYNQGLLLMMIAAAMVTHKQQLWKTILVLSLMTQFNLFATILSGSFLLALVYDKYRMRPLKTDQADLWAIAVWIGSGLLFLLTVLPPEDSYFRKDFTDPDMKEAFGSMRHSVKELLFFINRGLFLDLYNDYVIRIPWGPKDFWNYALGVIYFGVAAFSLKKSLLSLIFYISGFLVIALFFLLDFYSSVGDRHTMNAFLLLFFGMWLYRRDHKFQLIHYILIGIPSAIYLWVGFSNFREDYRYDFSSSKKTAAFIQDNYPGTTLVAYPDFMGESVSGYLGKEFYYISKGAEGSYVLWIKGKCDDWWTAGAESLLAGIPKLDRLKKNSQDKVLIITPYTIPDSACKRYNLVKVLDTRGRSSREAIEEYNGYLY